MSYERAKMATKVAKRFIAEKADVPPDFQGNPKVHGIDEPRGGGFSIMQNLQKSLVKEEKKEIDKQQRKRTQEEEKINASSRQFSAAVKEAMYWCGPDRTYRLTKQEQATGQPICPHCKEAMDKEKFTRSEKMYRCPGCGFKVPTGKVTTKKIEIEIEPDGEVEVEVTTANQRRN